MTKLLSALIWFLYGLSFVLSCIVAFIVRLFTFPFDRFNHYPNAVMMFFGKSIIVLNPFWKRHYFGVEKITNQVPGFIRVANHQSFLDMPLLATLPMNMQWVSKKELFSIPVLGWLMHLAGHISIDRGSTGAAKSLSKMKEPLEYGKSVMMFPEGTRSRVGQLKSFKKGAFYASMDTGACIQPIVIEGTYKCMKPDTWVMNFKGDLFVSILDPVFPENFGTVNDLSRHVHKLILTESERLKQLSAERSA